jgi:hypothetical protein
MDLDSMVVPLEKNVKADSSKDLLTIFTDQVDVKFTSKDGSVEQLRGHWCMLCKSVFAPVIKEKLLTFDLEPMKSM